MPPKTTVAWGEDADEIDHDQAREEYMEVLKEQQSEAVAERKKAEILKAKHAGSRARALSIMQVLDTNPETFTGWRYRLHRIMSGLAFDLSVGFVIATNAFTIGLETQIKSTVPLGCMGNCDDCSRQVDTSLICESVPEWIEIIEFVFLAIYVLELALRVIVYGPLVLRSRMVKFDAFLVFCALLDVVMTYSMKNSPVSQMMLIRLLRLGRLARALRLLVQFQTLWQLVQGLFHSLGTLVWMFVLLAVLLYISAIAGLEMISVNPSLPLDHPYNEAVIGNFGDFSKAVLTNIQIFSFDSIGSVYRPVIRENMWSFFYFISVILILSIALMNLVTAVMVNSSLEMAGEDKEAKKAWEAARKAKQMEQLKEMFFELDEDGSGELTLDEIENAPEEAQENLQEIAGTDDLTELFDLLDYDGGGTVGVKEFCDGVLKTTEGQPGALELSRLVKQCTDILKNTRDAKTVLTDPRKKFRELAKNGGATLPGGGGSGGASSTPKQLSRVNQKVDKVEKMLWQCSSDIDRLVQNINDRTGRGISKGIPVATATLRGPSGWRSPRLPRGELATRYEDHSYGHSTNYQDGWRTGNATRYQDHANETR